MGFKYTIALLVISALCIGIDGNFRKSLQTIQSTFSKIGKNVKPTIDKINDFLGSDEGGKAVEAITGAIDSAGKALPSVTSRDVVGIVTGTLDIVSSVTTLIPMYGPIVSTVLSLFSSVLGAVGGSGSEDIGSVVRREIEKALDKYEDTRLRNEASATARIYRSSQAYLNAKGVHQIGKHELASLSANVPIYQGVKFLSILGSKIKNDINKADISKAKRALEYTELYVKLAVLRTAILWQTYTLVKTAGHSPWTVNAQIRYIDAENAEDKKVLRFFTSPQYSQAFFFSVFYPSKTPIIMKFLEKNKLQFQRLVNLERGLHTLHPQKWPDWYMFMTATAQGYMNSRRWAGKEGRFYFTPISTTDNVFYLRPERWSKWYVYMQRNAEGYCAGWKGKPGPQGEWKVVRYSDGAYLISPKEWPEWFVYMSKTGSIRGWKGDPGKQGHWLID